MDFSNPGQIQSSENSQPLWVAFTISLWLAIAQLANWPGGRDTRGSHVSPDILLHSHLGFQVIDVTSQSPWHQTKLQAEQQRSKKGNSLPRTMHHNFCDAAVSSLKTANLCCTIFASSAKVICKVICFSLSLSSHWGNFKHLYLLS